MNKKANLNILIYSFDWRNLYETNISEIFGKFERDGLNHHANHIFSVNWSTKSYYKKINDNIETVHLKAHLGRSRFFYDLANIFLTPFLISKYKFIPDLVIVYDFPSIFSGIAAKLFWRAKIAVIVTNIPSQLIKTRRFSGIYLLYQNLSEFFAKYFIDYAIAISASTQAYLKVLSIPDGKIRVFTPNVIKRDKQFIVDAKVGFIREKYNIPKEKNIILSVGRLEPEKNFKALITSFHDLGDSSLVLVVVGEGRLLSGLKSLVADLHLSDRVIFAGLIGRENIWNFYRDADVFMLLSRSEGLGLVFWEAMYSKVPVIGPRIEGIAESIGSDGLRGFFWNEGDDITILRHEIDVCCKKTKEVEEMVLRAYDYVSEKINSNHVINDLIG